jgi:hypothetical protein
MPCVDPPTIAWRPASGSASGEFDPVMREGYRRRIGRRGAR